MPLVVLGVSSSCRVAIGPREACGPLIGQSGRPADLSCVASCTVKEINCDVLLHEVNLFRTNMVRNNVCPSQAPVPSPHTS